MCFNQRDKVTMYLTDDLNVFHSGWKKNRFFFWVWSKKNQKGHNVYRVVDIFNIWRRNVSEKQIASRKCFLWFEISYLGIIFMSNIMKLFIEFYISQTFRPLFRVSSVHSTRQIIHYTQSVNILQNWKKFII